MGKEPVESQGWLETQAWSQDKAAVTGGDRIGGGRGGWRPVPGGPDTEEPDSLEAAER